MYLKESVVPERPKIRTYLQTKQVSKDCLVFEAGSDSVTLKGSSVSELLPLLLQRLDGTHTLSSIKEQLPQVEPKVIDEALSLFARSNLLEDPSLPPPSTMAPAMLQHLEHQFNFWLSARNDRYGPQEMLSKAQVCILGSGELGTTVADLLLSAGVAKVLRTDTTEASASDGLSGHSNSKQMTTAKVSREIEQLESALTGSQLAILCEDFRTPLMCRLANEACLKLELPWISGYVDHNRASIGPFIIPRQTACFRCYEYRCQGNCAHGDPGSDPEAIAATKPQCFGMLKPFAGYAANYLALEAMKSLTKFAYPATAGRVHTINFFTMESEFHDVLKLPRCPSCSPMRHTPLMKIWELETATKIKK